jgi:hypothetical protein
MNDSDPSITLISAMHRVSAAAELARGSAMSRDAVVQLHRLSADASVVQRLRDAEVSRLPEQELTLTVNDAERVAQIVERLPKSDSRDNDLELAALLSDRIMHSVGHLAIAPDNFPAQREDRSTEASASRIAEHDSSRVLKELACEYGRDARRERALMKWLYGVSVVLLLAGVAIALGGIDAAQNGEKFRFPEFAAYGLVALVLLTFAALGVRHATRHSLAAQEAARLQRQFDGLDAYLSPMPPALRELVRATMVQRLFPRLLDDDEPWREPKWPDTDSLIEAIRTE